MPDAPLPETVVVFDLDDTLYAERDYQDSGFRAVCDLVDKLYGKSILAALDERRRLGERDPLAAVCALAGLPDSAKQSLLWVYRLHSPTIELDPHAAGLLRELRARSIAMAILTDGRSVTQRLKLRALGLAHLPAYISEEFGSEKPAPLRFERIMKDLPARAYVYIADNPVKDFIAPNALSWKTVGVRGGARNVHSRDTSHLSAAQLPQRWVDDLSGLSELLC